MYHQADLNSTAQCLLLLSWSLSLVENFISLWYARESPATPKIDHKVTEYIFENKHYVSSECMENISSVSHRSQEKFSRNPKIIWQKKRKKVYLFYAVHWVTRDHKYFQKSDQNFVTSQIWFPLTSAKKRLQNQQEYSNEILNW